MTNNHKYSRPQGTYGLGCGTRNYASMRESMSSQRGCQMNHDQHGGPRSNGYGNASCGTGWESGRSLEDAVSRNDRRTGESGSGCSRSARSARMSSARNNESASIGGGCGCGRSARSSRTLPTQSNNIPSIDEGCGCGCGNDDHGDCAKLLKQIQTVDFALYEVVLYLDAYPENCEALELYHKLLTRRRALMTQYEEACGPLTAWGNVSTDSWDWVRTPAPWEYPNG